MGKSKRAKRRPERITRSSFRNAIDQAITDLHRLYGDVDSKELEVVRLIRAAGGSWADVGQAFGMSAQSAHQRFRGTHP